MLLDTSGLLCLLHRAEPFHERARSEYKRATVRLTHSYILSEFVALGTARRIPRPAVLRFMRDLLVNPDIETVWADDALTTQAIAFLSGRLDKTYSLADAVSFLLMRERGIHESLTTDQHFEQEGFRKLLG